jgi:predicted RNA-binding protein with PIN domain
MVKRADEDIEGARDALVEQIVRFCGATGDKARVVFDGRGKQTESRKVFGGVEVVYSPGKASADSVIERAVYGLKNRQVGVVVTADRGIRDLCGGMGAVLVRPDAFLAMLTELGEDVASKLGRTSDGRSMGVLEDRLSETALQRLCDLRDDLDSS